MVHMRPHKKIRALLVARKDPTEKMEQAELFMQWNVEVVILGM